MKAKKSLDDVFVRSNHVQNGLIIPISLRQVLISNADFLFCVLYGQDTCSFINFLKFLGNKE